MDSLLGEFAGKFVQAAQVDPATEERQPEYWRLEAVQPRELPTLEIYPLRMVDTFLRERLDDGRDVVPEPERCESVIDLGNRELALQCLGQFFVGEHGGTGHIHEDPTHGQLRFA